MAIDLTKCAICAKDDQESNMEEVCKKYLLGTYSQEEAIKLVSKYCVSILEQNRSAVR